MKVIVVSYKDFCQKIKVAFIEYEKEIKQHKILETYDKIKDDHKKQTKVKELKKYIFIYYGIKELYQCFCVKKKDIYEKFDTTCDLSCTSIKQLLRIFEDGWSVEIKKYKFLIALINKKSWYKNILNDIRSIKSEDYNC